MSGRSTPASKRRRRMHRTPESGLQTPRLKTKRRISPSSTGQSDTTIWWENSPDFVASSSTAHGRGTLQADLKRSGQSLRHSKGLPGGLESKFIETGNRKRPRQPGVRMKKPVKAGIYKSQDETKDFATSRLCSHPATETDASEKFSLDDVEITGGIISPTFFQSPPPKPPSKTAPSSKETPPATIVDPPLPPTPSKVVKNPRKGNLVAASDSSSTTESVPPFLPNKTSAQDKSFDDMDDLTSDSWALLDQIESQLSQKPMEADARPVRPMETDAKPALLPVQEETKKLEPLGMTLGAGESYTKFSILSIDQRNDKREQICILEDANGRGSIQATLADDWFDVVISAGDILNIVWAVSNRQSMYKQHKLPSRRVESVRVDNQKNLIVLHPDLLISPTKVTISLSCVRRAILMEDVNVSAPTNVKALLGTLKHELFETALTEQQSDIAFLLETAKQLVKNNLLALVESNLSEKEAMKELTSVLDDYREWMTKINTCGVSLLENGIPSDSSIILKQTLATEEMMWSHQWGLKGAPDASVHATLVSGNKRTEGVYPLELKTGSKKFAQESHQGQVILYTLMLQERYELLQCDAGVLLYAPGIESHLVPASSTLIRALILARNRVAYAMYQLNQEEDDGKQYPEVIRNDRECSNCFQRQACMLYHASYDNCHEEGAFGDLFHQDTSHLSEMDLTYFRKWDAMVEMEIRDARKDIQPFWNERGGMREESRKGCLSDLTIKDRKVVKNGRELVTFIRTVDRSLVDKGIRVDDSVIVSAEAADEEKVLAHVTRGIVMHVDTSLVIVQTMRCIPPVVMNGTSSVGRHFYFRLDKDHLITGLRRAKENLVTLFTGVVPESITIGTSRTSRPLRSSPVDADTNQGDFCRRQLIVYLQPPRFSYLNVETLIQERWQRLLESEPSSVEVQAQCQGILTDFNSLNNDQKAGVTQVVNAMDYALIFGMPGSGKTWTIAFTVRLLSFLGYSVLVSAYTHSAVDNLLLKLIEKEVPVLRIGTSAQVHPSLSSRTLEQEIGSRLNSAKAVETRLKMAQVVGCTCLGVNSHVLFQKRRFDFCIVDEATQTTEPVVLGPLKCADTFVLVGDPHQLPPLVSSRRAREGGMDTSLFQKLLSTHPTAAKELRVQYRMNEEIMTLANHLVYDGKLRCGSTQVARNRLSVSAGGWWGQALNGRGVTFLDTDALDAKESSEKENAVEAEIVVSLVQVLLHVGISCQEIAVVSPFRAQVACIQRKIRTVEVSTIDKYQGRDKDIILVSFVRSNVDNVVGELLHDWRRINVALTRAKQKLVIVGSRSTLKGGPSVLRKMLELVERQEWMMTLPKDAVHQIQEHCFDKAVDTTMESTQPEAEDKMQVQVMKETSEDMEDIVPDAIGVKNRRARELKPISRDVAADFT